MNLRKLPYGYRYENGMVIIDECEREIVLRIFNVYLSGQSLLNIAEKLNAEKVEYSSGIVGWNKSRIKRIIEDERYVGDELYPAIINREVHDMMVELKQRKNTQQSINRRAPIYNLDVPMYCPECGGIMKRQNNSRGNVHRLCVNASCGFMYTISDLALLAELTMRMNRIIAAPEMIHEIESEHEANIEVTRLKNEIARTLEGYNFDKAALRQKMLELASKQYAEIDSNKYITQKLKAGFEKSSPLSEFSIELFRATVQSIFLNKDGSVGITLLNGQQIGKDETA